VWTRLEALSDLKLLMTTREALGLRRWEHTLPVAELEPGEAERLFLRSAPATQRMELALTRRRELRAICGTLEHYPLALVIAAPQLGEVGMTPVRLLQELQVFSHPTCGGNMTH
jgi:hypothetical protein